MFRVVVKRWSDDSIFTLFGDADLGLGGFSYLRRLSLSWWSKSCFFNLLFLCLCSLFLI